MAGVYEAHIDDVAISTAITILQVKAGATSSLEILRAWCSQSTLDATDQQRIYLLRKTVAATVTSFTPIKLRPGDAASDAVGGTAATGHTATAEGTDGDVLLTDAFNILNGWFYVPVPEERETVAPGGIIALKLPTAPGAAMNVTAGIRWREIG